MADVLVAGATGLIGRTFLELIEDDPAFPQVLALTRRKITSLREGTNIRQKVIDFDSLSGYRDELRAEAAFCALGTTIRTAGTRAGFRAVDYQLPLDLARVVLANGCRRFILISAVGADPNSRVFYNRVKGEVETALRALPFESIHILRPSLLLGRREEKRPGERLARILLTPLAPLTPARYRPIEARTVARSVIGILKNETSGIHIHEGADLRRA